MTAAAGLRVSLFGVPGAGLNLGVGALRESAVSGLLRHRPDADLTVFDDGWGVRDASIVVNGESHAYRLCGVRNSRRVHRPESYTHMRMSARLGLKNAGLELVDRSTAVWDVSGGDSFADLYGRDRFNTVTLPKELALRRGRPLVLLPQTYGPFADGGLRSRAQTVLARARAAWARDGDSYARLRELLGSAFDPERHRQGVDLAFGLRPAEPETSAADAVRTFLASADGAPVAGLNVSGLLLSGLAATQQYGLTIDYDALVKRLAERILSDGAHLYLVPHVLGDDPRDSDEAVTLALASRLQAGYPGRVAVAPRSLGAGGRKWLIGQTAWFSGARMHATIAGLSSGVPTAAVAYSLKVRGVFASCGQQEHVADGRALTTGEALEVLIASWAGRDRARADLAQRLPSVLARAVTQMEVIVDQSAAVSGREST